MKGTFTIIKTKVLATLNFQEGTELAGSRGVTSINGELKYGGGSTTAARTKEYNGWDDWDEE